MVKFKYPAGVVAVCKSTGFKGHITSRRELINGCLMYQLSPEIADGKLEESVWIDEDDVKTTSKKDGGSHFFKHELGIKVKVDHHKKLGKIVSRKLDKNGCEAYMIEIYTPKLFNMDHLWREWHFPQEFEVYQGSPAQRIWGKIRSYFYILENVVHVSSQPRSKPVQQKRTGCSMIRGDS